MDDATDRPAGAIDPQDPAAHRPKPGDIILPSGLIAAEPIVGEDVSTPLEEDETEGTIPPCPLWAMKERRHIQWHLLPTHDRHDRLRECVGTGDDAIYAIDDGRNHATLGRRVGAKEGECEYCLVGRVEWSVYEDLAAGRLPASQAFNSAGELALCGVAIEEDIRSSNIFDVERYASIDDVPAEYRPGAPFLKLDEDLEITA